MRKDPKLSINLVEKVNNQLELGVATIDHQNLEGTVKAEACAGKCVQSHHISHSGSVSHLTSPFVKCSISSFS